MRRRMFLSLVCAAAPAATLEVAAIDRHRILSAADRYLKEKPVTVISTASPRSAGGKHDFFSEGDYWWPDLQSPQAHTYSATA